MKIDVSKHATNPDKSYTLKYVCVGPNKLDAVFIHAPFPHDEDRRWVIRIKIRRMSMKHPDMWTFHEHTCREADEQKALEWAIHTLEKAVERREKSGSA